MNNDKHKLLLKLKKTMKSNCTAEKRLVRNVIKRKEAL